MSLYAQPSYVPNQALFALTYSNRQLRKIPRSTQDVENLWTTFCLRPIKYNEHIPRNTPYLVCDESKAARTVRVLAGLLRTEDDYEAECASSGFDISVIVSEMFILGMQSPTASLTAVKAVKDLRVRPLFFAMRKVGMCVFREIWKVVYILFF